MKQKTKKNYYELLDIMLGASKHEIEEAYERIKRMYSEDSVALYSLYTKEEKEALLKEVTDAYETLKDSFKRQKYDNQLTFPHEETLELDIDSLMKNKNMSEEPEDLEKIHAVEPLDNNAKFKRPIAAMDDLDPLTAEQYRILFSNLEQINLRNSYKTFAITSSIKGEGKSVTSVNLAYMMAKEFKKKVILVECDLRNPTVASFLDNTQAHGLADLLEGTIQLEEAIVHLEGTSLFFLPALRSFKNSAELLVSHRLNAVFSRLKTEFDYIIVDCPPIISIVDMQIIAKWVDGVLLVVRANMTPMDLVRKAFKSLPADRMVGIVLNGTDTKFEKYYYK